jgi:hypothetical protein
VGNGKCGRAVSPSCIEEARARRYLRNQRAERAIHLLYARAEACDMQWAQQYEFKHCTQTHLASCADWPQRSLHGILYLHFVMAAVDNWSCESHRQTSPLRASPHGKKDAPLCEARRSRNFAGDGGGHEHSGGGFEAVLKLQLHSRWLPERATRPRQIE